MGNGMYVYISFTKDGIMAKAEETRLHNVTEIHFGYRDGMVAFESDIHGTGITYRVADIDQFEVRPAKRIYSEF